MKVPKVISTTSYESIANEFAIFCDWLTELDVPWKGTRIAEYARYVAGFPEVQRSVREGRTTPSDDEYMRFFEIALEVDELNRIYRAFSQRSDEALRERLLKLREGVARRTHEANSNRQARDFSFELATAAHFASSGLSVDLSSDADVRIPVGDDCVVLIECKRPLSVGGLADRVKDGLAQLVLRTAQERAAGKRFRSFLALNVSYLVNPNFGGMRLASSKAIEDRLSHHVSDWVSANARSLAPAFKPLECKLLGLMLVIDAPAYVLDEEREFIAHQINIFAPRRYSRVEREINTRLGLPQPQH